MYLKDYDIIKINNGFRLVKQSDPDNRFNPMDTGLFEPGDTFTVGPSGWLEFTGNKHQELVKQI
tara:strand:- start:312 stop:503 length:192 start_codon:yes stop_codon:yes gene_type:complete